MQFRLFGDSSFIRPHEFQGNSLLSLAYDIYTAEVNLPINITRHSSKREFNEKRI